MSDNPPPPWLHAVHQPRPVGVPTPLPHLWEDDSDELSLADEEWHDPSSVEMSPARAPSLPPPTPAPSRRSDIPVVVGLSIVSLAALAATLFMLVFWV